MEYVKVSEIDDFLFKQKINSCLEKLNYKFENIFYLGKNTYNGTTYNEAIIEYKDDKTKLKLNSLYGQMSNRNFTDVCKHLENGGKAKRFGYREKSYLFMDNKGKFWVDHDFLGIVIFNVQQEDFEAKDWILF